MKKNNFEQLISYCTHYAGLRPCFEEMSGRDKRFVGDFEEVFLSMVSQKLETELAQRVKWGECPPEVFAKFVKVQKNKPWLLYEMIRSLTTNGACLVIHAKSLEQKLAYMYQLLVVMRQYCHFVEKDEMEDVLKADIDDADAKMVLALKSVHQSLLNEALETGCADFYFKLLGEFRIVWQRFEPVIYEFFKQIAARSEVEKQLLKNKVSHIKFRQFKKSGCSSLLK